MAYPKEFNYDSEEEFTQNLVKPLLTRLGFSVVLDYHGTMEFGKDLIIGEFDRFSHVRYYGIQVKHHPSISLEDSHDIIKDCEQAFTNPFKHPQTGEESMISTFYVINCGTISDQAKQNFFSSTRPKYGDNARLIDGNALVQLDRSIASVSIQQVGAILYGLRLELQYNNAAVPTICDSLRKTIDEDGPYPVQRGSSHAVSSFLQQPQAYLGKSIPNLQLYWQWISNFNRIVDSIDTRIWAGNFKLERVSAALGVGDSIQTIGTTLLGEVDEQLEKLGPLVMP